MVGLKELEENFSTDFKDIDSLIKSFEWTRGNKPATSEDARTLALLVRKAIDGNKMNVELTRILMLLVLKLSLLVQQDADTPVKAPDKTGTDHAKWFEQWENAQRTWDEMIE